MSLAFTNTKKKTELDYLEAIVRTGSFSAAANALFITQSAVSQQIKKMEDAYGVALLYRERKPIRLTPEGAFLINHLREIRKLEKAKDQYFRDIHELHSGHIRIGSNPCRTSTLLAPALAHFHAKYPGISIDVRDYESYSVGRALLANEVDFCFTIRSRIHKDMDYIRLAHERVFLALPPNHRLYNKAARPQKLNEYVPQVDFREFANDPFILVDHGLKFNQYFYDLCRKNRCDPKVFLRMNSITLVHQMVARGLGCALVPEELAFCSTDSCVRVRYFDLSDQLPHNPVVLAYLKNHYLSKAARKLIDRIVFTVKNNDVPCTPL